MRLPQSQPSDIILGLSIDIQGELAERISDIRAASGDVDAREVTPHITVHGPVALDGALLPHALGHAAHIISAHRPFTLEIGGVGTFLPTSPVTYLQVGRGRADCEGLARELNSGPLRFRSEFPYHPHVTLAQGVGYEKLEEAADAGAPLRATIEVTAVRIARYIVSAGWQTLAYLPLLND